MQFATKRVNGNYEVALIVDGSFQRSGVGPDVLALLNKLAGPIMSSLDGDGVEVVVNITAMSAIEVVRANLRLARQRAIAEAEAEAGEIEKLTAAAAREKAARQAGIVESQMVQG